MMLGFHGGKCCVIKVIHGFYNHPDEMAEELEKQPFNDADALGHNVSSDESFFTDAAPAETYRERFARFVEFCDKHRPAGIIEVVITNESFWTQKKYWHDILVNAGFRIVNENLNSNSGNICYIYHRNSNLPFRRCDCCEEMFTHDSDSDCCGCRDYY